MFTSSGAEQHPDYTSLAHQLQSLLEGENDLVANAAQFAAFVYETVGDLNWAGFYLVRPAKKAATLELLVGPFQGKVACARIPFGKGVCGSAAQDRRTYLVPDVHAFPGHIACDSASNSEIVIPLIKGGQLFGVFDMDSPGLNRFSHEDQVGLESLVAIFVAATDFK